MVLARSSCYDTPLELNSNMNVVENNSDPQMKG